MNGAYIPYILTEGFCVVFAGAILHRLQNGIAEKYETLNLRKMIAAYIVMVAGDMLWAVNKTGLVQPGNPICEIFNAISIAAVVPGCYYWFAFVEERIQPKKKFSPTAHTLIALPAVLMCIVDISSAFNDWVFYLDAAGDSQTGKFFWLQGVVTFGYLMVPTLHALYAAFHTSAPEKRREYLTYVLYMCGCFAIVGLEDSLRTTPLLELGVFAAILVLFLTLYLDREYELAEQERELSESRTAVMLSQIQPHFLYNTLCVIQAMCTDDPPAAAQTTAEFADYLRGNLDSLRRKEPIPFEQELQHTQIYLSLEQKRYDERLRVEYDIRADGFLLPALTLQPVVENAVKHGVSEREEGGTVRISTEETKRAYTITVRDDGVGFDVSAVKHDGRSHIGISSVRERLAAMCGGTLEIESTPGEGTTALITIPKEEQPQ